jgi:hypothetical protein
MSNHMKLGRLLAVALLAGAVVLPTTVADAAAASQSERYKVKKKKAHRYLNRQGAVRKNFRATLPGEPNQAGMTDDCSYWYNIYGHMPAGCDQNGRSFYIFDND